MHNFAKLALSFIVTASLVSVEPSIADAGSKRDRMTADQKTKLRKWAREWCLKNHVKGSAMIAKVEILSDGRVRCWWRQ